ncbi:hypothetical protein GCM10025867_09170 [Frondihabitans sucicola]|uniref:N-acetyltransferase domain-containing protein n=1 Tax=Frondihabitans sucicola TaxID=1268041 RepID=A0ABM8GJW9_9MICO|nr:hypothetical protein GCM10025867_09170 [Frondihabitans sucicola]
MPAVADLDRQTSSDYPETPASRHDEVGLEQLEAWLDEGLRYFGAWVGERLVAVTLVARDAERAETEFTAVAQEHRRRGLGTGVKALSVLSLAERGVTLFGAGGAAGNIGILRACESLGYVLTERWVSFDRDE